MRMNVGNEVYDLAVKMMDVALETAYVEMGVDPDRVELGDVMDLVDHKASPYAMKIAQILQVLGTVDGELDTWRFDFEDKDEDEDEDGNGQAQGDDGRDDYQVPQSLTGPATVATPADDAARADAPASEGDAAQQSGSRTANVEIIVQIVDRTGYSVCNVTVHEQSPWSDMADAFMSLAQLMADYAASGPGGTVDAMNDVVQRSPLWAVSMAAERVDLSGELDGEQEAAEECTRGVNTNVSTPDGSITVVQSIFPWEKAPHSLYMLPGGMTPDPSYLPYTTFQGEGNPATRPYVAVHAVGLDGDNAWTEEEVRQVAMNVARTVLRGDLLEKNFTMPPPTGYAWVLAYRAYSTDANRAADRFPEKDFLVVYTHEKPEPGNAFRAMEMDVTLAMGEEIRHHIGAAMAKHCTRITLPVFTLDDLTSVGLTGDEAEHEVRRNVVVLAKYDNGRWSVREPHSDTVFDHSGDGILASKRLRRSAEFAARFQHSLVDAMRIATTHVAPTLAKLRRDKLISWYTRADMGEDATQQSSSSSEDQA